MSFAAILLRALAGSLIVSPAMAAAQDTAPPAARQEPSGGFDSLWTGWSGASQESIRAEAEAARTPQGATEAPRRYQAGSAALGERVGEVVRVGDCQEGERLAREAGDFPLVEAVRRHCRPAPQPR